MGSESGVRGEPSSKDIAWMRTLLWCVKEGGTITLPQSGLKYVVDKQNRTMTLINPEKLPEDRLKWHEHDTAEAAADAVGYRVRMAAAVAADHRPSAAA